MTEHAPWPMATVEEASRLVCYANPAFCRLLDKPMEQVVGKPLDELLPTNRECMVLCERVFRTGKPESHTEAHPSKTNSAFWSYMVWPVLAEEGHVGIMIQVTETTIPFHDRMLAMSEALLLGSVQQHELTEEAGRLNASLRMETSERKQAEQALQDSAEQGRLATTVNAGLTTANAGLTSANVGLTSVNAKMTTANEGMLVNINVLKLSEQRLTATRDFAEAVIESVPPLLILEPDLRVRTANEAFCKTFGVTAEETEKQLIYELGNGQWNIPALRTLFEDILPRNSSFQKYEVTHDFEDLGRRTMLMSGRKVDSMQAIVLSIEDITARKQAEQKIKDTRDFAEAVIESVPPLLVLEPDLRVRTTNEAFCKTFGVTAEETEKQLIYELGNGQWNIPALRKLFEEILPHNSSFQKYEVTHDFEGLGRRIMLMSGRKVESMHAIVLSIEDITARKEAEETAFLSKEHFRQLANGIPNLSWTANAEGWIFWYNDRWYEYTGTTTQQMEGWGWQSVHDPKLLPDVMEKWKASIASGCPFDMEFPLRGADGRFRPFLTRVLPLKDAQGRVMQWFGTNMDITDLVQAREVLARSREELEKLVLERTAKLQEAIGELLHFSYTITHDMRAPLRAMLGYGEMLVAEEASLSEAGRMYVARIGEAAKRMDNLIIDALDYAKLSDRAMELRVVDAGALLCGMLRSYLHYQVPAAKISISEHMPPVLANEAGLTQCFSNLLNNAIKFVQPGEIPEIRIWAEEREQEAEGRGQESEAQPVVRLWIEDKGIGIDHEYLEKIFGMFQRLNVNLEGTGIGLALVKKATERMGGKVGVESAVGKGSRFWLEFKKGVPSGKPEAPLGCSAQ